MPCAASVVGQAAEEEFSIPASLELKRSRSPDPSIAAVGELAASSPSELLACSSGVVGFVDWMLRSRNGHFRIPSLLELKERY